MRKLLTVILVFSLVFSMSFSVYAGEKENERNKRIDNDNNFSVSKGSDSIQKSFKNELNNKKKLIVSEKNDLEDELQILLFQYSQIQTSGDIAAGEALAIQIEEMETKLLNIKAEMKQVINERYMITKTLYSEEELSQFENASQLVEQMYEDARTLSLGSIMIRDNIIKLDSPAYIKGGRTIIPVRAITEGIGATVLYNPETYSVKIEKDDIEIVFMINSKTVYINGVENVLDAEAEITNQRTYVPLRFIAETFGLDVSFDEETDTIDIEEVETEEAETEEVETEEVETEEAEENIE